MPLLNSQQREQLLSLLEDAFPRRSCGRLVEQQHRFSGGLPTAEPQKH